MGELQLIAHEKYIIKATYFGVGVCRDCSMSVFAVHYVQIGKKIQIKNNKRILIKQNHFKKVNVMKLDACKTEAF